MIIKKNSAIEIKFSFIYGYITCECKHVTVNIEVSFISELNFKKNYTIYIHKPIETQAFFTVKFPFFCFNFTNLLVTDICAC